MIFVSQLDDWLVKDLNMMKTDLTTFLHKYYLTKKQKKLSNDLFNFMNKEKTDISFIQHK